MENMDGKLDRDGNRLENTPLTPPPPEWRDEAEEARISEAQYRFHARNSSITFLFPYDGDARRELERERD